MGNNIFQDRRKFLKEGIASAMGILFAGHFFAQEYTIPKRTNNEPLISEIKLLTAQKIDRMVDFYHHKLALPLISQTHTSCSFQAGSSVLSFTYNTRQLHSPFYHFAFNIPENKIQHAEEWQLRKTTLIEPPNHLKDLKRFKKNVVHFRHWDAHSIFFYDPAGNVVEYIARHTLLNSSKGKFSSKDILCISEIALIVDDVRTTQQQISKHLGINQYKSSSKQFSAMGDEQGLLLLMAKDTLAVFRQGRKRKIFSTEVFLNFNEQKPELKLEKYPYFIA